MAQTVTVAVDGGPASKSALEWATAWASGASARLNVTSVVEAGWDTADRPYDDFRQPYQGVLDEAASEVQRTAPQLDHTTTLLFGDPAEELVKASGEADLLVIGTNKTNRITGVIRGTVTLKVAASSRCPVVVVPVGWQQTAGQIVVGYEDDETSEVALQFADREAKRMQRPLHVVHSWRIPATVALDAGWVVDDKVVAAHEELLEKAADGIRRSYPELEVRSQLGEGSAARVLVEEAENASMLVVGTHRRGVLAGLILGSVSHDVLLNMPCPVAVVPHPDEPIRVYPEVVDEVLL